MEQNLDHKNMVSAHHHGVWKMLALVATLTVLVLIAVFLSNENQVEKVKSQFISFQSVLSDYNPELSAAVITAVRTGQKPATSASRISTTPAVTTPTPKKQQITCRQSGWPNLTTTVYVTIDPPLPVGSFNANDANGKLTAVCTVGAVMN